MNPSAIRLYHKNSTGSSIKACHSPKANKMIDKVVMQTQPFAERSEIICFGFRS